MEELKKRRLGERESKRREKRRKGYRESRKERMRIEVEGEGER